jgi:hypothetical protein
MKEPQQGGGRGASPRRRRMPQRLAQGCLVLLVALMLSASASPAGAQAWSRGLQDLAISADECMLRAGRALQAEGYAIGTRGDDFIAASKAIHTAIVMCDPGPGGRTWVNIVVVSCGASDGGVPGSERVRLQQQMESTASGGGGEIGAWRPVGSGDCTGHDVGSTQGPRPEPGRCNPGFAGMTAVCFDTWCTYKNVTTESCTGGSNPGNMFRCGDAGPSPGGGPAGSTGSWRAVGSGDCSDHDVGSTQGPRPEPGRCNPEFAGMTAVCFGTWCTYKNISTQSCTGGSNPGDMFTCDLPSRAGGQAGGGCTDPRTLTIMDEWLAGADPPDNQRPGWSVHYEAWGRLVGRTPTNSLTVNGPPDTRLSRCEWLWANSTGLQSTNLGTLREYLLSRSR